MSHVLLSRRRQGSSLQGGLGFATSMAQAKYPRLWAGLWGGFNPAFVDGVGMARNFGAAGGRLVGTNYAGLGMYRHGRSAICDGNAYWIGGNGKLTGATDITFAAHVRINTYQAIPRIISCSNASHHELHMYTASDNKKLKFELWNGTTDIFKISASVVPENRFVHLATVWRRGVGISFYIDGVLDVFEATATTATLTPNDGFTVGARGSSVADSRINGEMGEALVYQRALVASEIAMLASGASPLMLNDALLLMQAQAESGGEEESSEGQGQTPFPFVANPFGKQPFRWR